MLIERLAKIEEKINQVFEQNEERKQLLKDYMRTTDQKIIDLEKLITVETNLLKKEIERTQKDDVDRYSAKRVEWIMKWLVWMILVSLFASILKDYLK